MRQLNPALRMEASPKSVMRKEKKSNPVIRKEKKRKVPVQEDPIHEVPSVDVLQDPPRDVQVGVDDYHVPAAEVVNEELDRSHDVIKAPQEVVQHIPDPVQVVEEGSRPKRSPKPNKKYSPEIYDLSYVGKRTRSRRSIRRAGTSS